MTPATVPRPARMAHLDTDPRGYVVFFCIQPEPGDPLDFRYLNGNQIGRCINERRCMICGTRLGSQMVFVGGPLSVRNRTFADPPAHDDCTRYALRVCPYLTIPRYSHSVDRPALAQHPDAVGDPTASHVKPDRWALYRCRGYRVEMVEGKPLFVAQQALSIEWWQP